MVNVDKYMPQDRVDSKTISTQDYPKGKLTIVRASEVLVKSGFSAGQEKLVIEVSDKDKDIWSYWANKTSIGTLAGAYGNDTDKWTDKTFKLAEDTVRVRGQKRMALFAEI